MSDEISRDIDDAEVEREAREQAKRDRVAMLHALESWQHMLDEYDGRQVLWSILESCGIYRSSFSQSSKQMAFNEGRRTVGLLVLNQVLTVAPNAYNLMRNEAQEREKRRAKLDV